MALNPEKVIFLLRQIQNSEHNAFKGIVTQLFSYLKTEVKDNPIFDNYEQECVKWSNWPEEDNNSFGYGRWNFPDTIDDAKVLSYHIYKAISKNERN